MRYSINFDKLVNRLVPHYMGGRNLILYLQAIIKPIQSVNDEFVNYAKELRIEASMTSQIFKFEWFLNRRLSKYFANGGKIVIKNTEHVGTPIYHSSSNVPQSSNIVLRTDSEGESGDDGDTLKLYKQTEKSVYGTYSFIVNTPAIDTSKITQEQYNAMLKHYIERYRISGKTYIIKYISNE